MSTRPLLDQQEIPGTESEERIPELHALGLELYDLQEERRSATLNEKAKREEIAAFLKDRKLDHYHVDGIELWLEPGKEKVKVRIDSEDEDDA